MTGEIANDIKIIVKKELMNFFKEQFDEFKEEEQIDDKLIHNKIDELTAKVNTLIEIMNNLSTTGITVSSTDTPVAKKRTSRKKKEDAVFIPTLEKSNTEVVQSSNKKNVTIDDNDVITNLNSLQNIG